MERRSKRKGSPLRAALSALGTKCAPASQKSRDVEAEGGEDHIVDGVRRDARARGYPSTARPTGLVKVGVLNAPLHAAFFTLVDLVPEADSAFPDVPGVTGATAGTGQAGGCRTWFDTAVGVIGKGR